MQSREAPLQRCSGAYHIHLPNIEVAGPKGQNKRTLGEAAAGWRAMRASAWPPPRKDSEPSVPRGPTSARPLTEPARSVRAHQMPRSIKCLIAHNNVAIDNLSASR